MQPGAVLYTQGFGSRPESVEVPFITNRAPTTLDTMAGAFPIGKFWVNTITGNVYCLGAYSTSGGTLSATWAFLGGTSGDLNTLTGDSGGAIGPSSGNINTLGTANQITVTGSGSTLTWSIPSAFTAPGSITATTSITATLGDITATNGNLVLSAAGNKLKIHATTAASDSVGTSGVMSGTPGAVTVTTSACTASSVILFSRATTGGTPGQVSITAQSGGSFTLTSTGNETSTFNYLIIN